MLCYAETLDYWMNVNIYTVKWVLFDNVGNMEYSNLACGAFVVISHVRVLERL